VNYLIPKRINSTEREVVETMEADRQAVAVEALILIVLIALVVSRVLLDLLREIVDRETPLDDGKESSRIPPRRWPSREPSSGPTIPDSSRDDPTS
jgi:hypothetical protein